MNRSATRAAFRASVPVLLGYLSLGTAFGLVLVDSGLPWWLSPLMATLVYAGAGQFMAVGLITAGSGALEIGLLTLLINARHAVYGLSVLDKFKDAGARKPYLVFGLTDETFALVSTLLPPEGVGAVDFYASLTALDQLYWISGCTAGALIGKALPFDSRGLDFSLTALFVVLLVEQIRSLRRIEPYAIALAASLLAYFLGAPRDFYLIAMLATLGGLALFGGRLRA
jgi:4-azaleucine resistance transporter AzlC